MSHSKRHHSIPKFYLDGFSSQGIIWVFDREKNLYRAQTPLNTLVETHYYSVQKNNGIYDNSLEEKMATIESYAAPIIRHLDDGGELSSKDKYTLSVFVSLLKSRVPEHEKVIEELRSEMLKRLGPVVDRSPNPFEPLQPRPSFIPPDVKPVDALKLVQELELLAINPQEAHNDFLKNIIPSTIEMSNFLFQMQWFIAHASSDTSFVTSDNPFLIVPPEGYDPNGPTGVGIASPGATKIIPLSSKSCLLIFDKGEGTVRGRFTRAQVRGINLIITNGCMKYVISKDESLLRYLVKRTRIDERKRNPKIQSS